ncbi:OmpA family protein [Oscillospiraceae bacterium OttesenSCG-928-F05]|nr:OmpA family protein [Oscillospiraceae bacterium OttesenSCG-928-F05]
MAKAPPPEEKPAGSPAWMSTYGDMITLVLVFFVLLYSFSTIDASKWRELVSAFSGGPSIFEGGTQSIPDPVDPDTQDEYESSHMIDASSEWDVVVAAVGRYAEENDLRENIEIEANDVEITIRFTDNILFDSGRADLKDIAKPVLDGLFQDIVAQYIENLENIRIEGHTDSRPIRTSQFRDNWDLSSARADSVLRYLLASTPEIEPSVYFCGGYGEYKPVDTNDTEEGMARNRRVDIVLVRPLQVVIDEKTNEAQYYQSTNQMT